MGRYKQRDITIREFDDVIIVIADRNTIWALNKRGPISVAFHRWFAPLNTYEDWRRFRERMRANKNLTLWEVYRIAAKWGITSQGTTRSPTEIINRIIESTQQSDSRKDGKEAKK